MANNSEWEQLSADQRVALTRSQSFWGLMVWIDEMLLSKKPFNLRHFYILSALVDRERAIQAGANLEPMSSARLTHRIRKDFLGEFEGTEPRLSQRQAEEDLTFLSAKQELIWNDRTGLGWRPTAKGIGMMDSISDDLAALTFTQAKLLKDIVPDRETLLTEKDGFFHRAKKMLDEFFRHGGGKKVAVIALAATLVGGAVDRGINMLTPAVTTEANIVTINNSSHDLVITLTAERNAIIKVAIDKGPRDFAGETLT